MSKVFSSEAAWYVTDEAIQIHGGMGYMRDSGLEKVQRDLRIFRIFEGTNDILRLFIALTGLQYAGENLKFLQQAVKDPIKNFAVLINEAGSRSKTAMGLNKNKSQVLDLHPSLMEASDALTRDVEKFGKAVEMLLMRYKKDVINQQFLLKRVADVAIDLYVSISVLSRSKNIITENSWTYLRCVGPIALKRYLGRLFGTSFAI